MEIKISGKGPDNVESSASVKNKPEFELNKSEIKAKKIWLSSRTHGQISLNHSVCLEQT